MNPEFDSRPEPSREELIALVAAQATEIAALKARITELERRFGLDSANSSKPRCGRERIAESVPLATLGARRRLGSVMLHPGCETGFRLLDRTRVRRGGARYE